MTTNTARPALERVTVNDVYATLVGGGSVSVEEWPGTDPALERFARRVMTTSGGALLVEVYDDVDGTHGDRVYMHGDEQDRLAVVSRAIEALESARDALEACQWADRKG